MLRVSHLRKSFGQTVAVQDVSFSVAAGECVALLGPNGAGKTTTLSMVSGLIQPDSGEVLIQGQPLGAHSRMAIGLVPQEVALYDELSGFENLRLLGALYPLTAQTLQRRIEESARSVGLFERLADKVKNLSGGMKRRLNIAATLLHDPALLLFDEPTVGIDPQSRNAIFDHILALKAQGKTVIYTTHYMEEAERLCDRIVIVDHGRIVADERLSALQQRAQGHPVLVIECAQEPQVTAELLALPGVRGASQEGRTLTVEMAQMETAPQLLKWCSDQALHIHFFTLKRPNLESVFLTLTGKNLRDV